MRYLSPHQIIELTSLHHVLDLLTHIDKFLIFLLFADLLKHVVEDISDHFNLILLLQLVVLISQTLGGDNVVFFALLSGRHQLGQLAHLHMHVLLLGRQFGELFVHVFVY